MLTLDVLCPISINTSRYNWLLKPGLYLYFGSAKGKTATSLEKRIARHFKNQKRIFWHIDRLTTHSDSKILNVFHTTRVEITECNALQDFVQKFHTEEIIPNFGSSDCKSDCTGHLLFLSRKRTQLDELHEYFFHDNWIVAHMVEKI